MFYVKKILCAVSVITALCVVTTSSYARGGWDNDCDRGGYGRGHGGYNRGYHGGYYTPAPRYYAPPVVYTPPVYYRPQPVYYRPRPVYYTPAPQPYYQPYRSGLHFNIGGFL